MADRKFDAVLLQLVHRMGEVLILPHGVCLAALAVVRDSEVGKDPLGDDVRQGTGFFYFFDRIIIAREFLTHKADTAHAGIELDMRLDFNAELFTTMRELLRIIEAVDRLRNVLAGQIGECNRGSGSAR